MKRLARKKRDDGGGGGNAPWLATFADLMNLLLCFFVLLFSMSNVDTEKFEEISISFANAIGIFDGGATALGEGQLISSGMSQLNNLDTFFNSMGELSTQEGEEYQNQTGELDKKELEEAKETIQGEMSAQNQQMFEQVSELTEDFNLGDYVELDMDPEHRFVLLSLKGSILFKSGKADIIEEAKPVLSKLGDLLKKFDGYSIEIVGHTDNVPMTSGAFKDNNWLSSARALNAAEYLIEQNKLDPTKVKYSGRGEYEPVASNKTAEGRAKNRRIEIRIYNELSNR